MKLENKIAIVSGGSSGIGEATSLLLAEKGAKVVAVYNKNTERADEFKKKISKLGDNFLIIQSDITDKKGQEKIFSLTKEKFGSVDILVNNAGGVIKSDIPMNEKLRESFELNFFQVVHMTQLFEKQKDENSLGKIVNISSTAGSAPWTFTGGLRYPDYSCAKAALDLYTRQCAKLFEGKILVNGVAPGSTKTPPWEWATKEFLDIRAKEAMIGRFMEASEIAHAVVFALENDAMNGEIIVVDGGNQLN